MNNSRELLVENFQGDRNLVPEDMQNTLLLEELDKVNDGGDDNDYSSSKFSDNMLTNVSGHSFSKNSVGETSEVNSKKLNSPNESKFTKKPMPRPRKKVTESEMEPLYEDSDSVISIRNKNDNDHSEEQNVTSQINAVSKTSLLENFDKISDHLDEQVPNRNTETIPNKQEEQLENNEQSHEIDVKKIIGIIVHQSDYLQADILVKHPLVKVYLIDTNTGKYLKKSNPDRPAAFFYEDSDDILPLMTKSFDFKAKRSLIPIWEELLLFNEDFQYILQVNPAVIIMFEILDFVSFSIASSQYKKLGPEGGWHKIAWAFLKPVGSNGHLNVDKKLRLQLYKPIFSYKDHSTNNAYSWWAQQIWDPYPATLYVTVKGFPPPQHLVPSLRSQVALQEEKTSSAIPLSSSPEEQTSEKHSGVTNKQNSEYLSCPVWSRLPTQSCKIPNTKSLSFATPSKGCFIAKFSNSGLLLACTMASEETFSIHLYSIPDGKEHTIFIGHQGIIYDLCWSSNDSLLLSGSADCTVCIWDTEKKKTKCLQMLPHPSFVYCVKFHGHRNWLLATGCNDHVVRFWVRQHKSDQYELVQELEGHRGFVNSLCFIQQDTLVSAGSDGSLIMWACDRNSFSRKNITPWKNQKELIVRDLKGIIINKVVIHPGGQRLLVHSRDSMLRMLDIKTGIVIQWFRGAINNRIQSSCCLTPCGSWVFSASEDGSVYVWNADTGELTAIYSGLNFLDMITCIDFHPYENMVVFSSHGFQSRVLLCVFNKLHVKSDVGLQLLKKSTMGSRKQKEVQSSEKKYMDSELASQLSVRGSLSEPAIRTKDNSYAFPSPNNNRSEESESNGLETTSALEETRKVKLDFMNLIKKMDIVLSFKPPQQIQNVSQDSE